MNCADTMNFINSYSKSGGKITDLSRARELMDRIGNPEKKLRFVHIAGTNGKGSVVEYISCALISAGYKTGQFTSPFILRYNDRIRINGCEISDDVLCRIAETVKNKIDSKPYSQFEITMAIAMLWYLEEKCDIVVLETGIGGLLDSTNVIPPPLLSVITSISLDHTAILGNTVEEIAFQKAGIIKKGSAVVSSIDNPETVTNIIRNTAAEIEAEFIQPDQNSYIPVQVKDFSLGGIPFTYKGIEYHPAMPGTAQSACNAPTAIEACLYLRKKGFDIKDEDIKHSIETACVKGRLQVIDGEPPVIVDGGHNENGVFVLSCQMRHIRHHNKKIYTIAGMVDTKDYQPCIELIAKLSDKVFTVDGFAPNCVPAEKLAEIAGRSTLSEASFLAEAVKNAKALALENNGIVIVCGSLYLASEYLNKYGDK